MTISKKNKATYHKALLMLRESGPEDKDFGICWNAQIPESVVGALSSNWSKFSGDVTYPVPSGKEDVSPSFAYLFYGRWDKRTKYGRLRWELLDFLIEATKPEDNTTCTP